MKWVTWEQVGVDRMACAWLILKYIDWDAEFLFVPAGHKPLPEGRPERRSFAALRMTLPTGRSAGARILRYAQDDTSHGMTLPTGRSAGG